MDRAVYTHIHTNTRMHTHTHTSGRAGRCARFGHSGFPSGHIALYPLEGAYYIQRNEGAECTQQARIYAITLYAMIGTQLRTYDIILC